MTMFAAEDDILHPLASLKWEECAKLQEGIKSARAVRLQNKVYIGGAITCDDKVNPRIYAYNYEEDSWQPPMDSPTDRPALAAYNDQLVLAGGNEICSGEATNNIWVLKDSESKALIWDVNKYPPMPTSRSGATGRGVCYEGHSYLLVAGGLGVDSESFLNVVEVFNGQVWSKVQSLPMGCLNTKSFVEDGKWWCLVGGEGQKLETVYASLGDLIATSTTETPKQPSVWKQLPEVSLMESSPAYYKRRLIAIGGRSPDTTGAPSRDILLYKSRTQSWMTVGELPIPLMSCTTIALPTGDLLVVGGETTEAQYSASVYKGYIEATSFSGGCFEMRSLDRLEAATGINIAKKLSLEPLCRPDSLAEAMKLKQEVSAGILQSYTKREDCNRALIEAWSTSLHGSGLQPTWGNLLDVLQKFNLQDTVQRMKEYMTRIHSRESSEIRFQETGSSHSSGVSQPIAEVGEGNQESHRELVVPSFHFRSGTSVQIKEKPASYTVVHRLGEGGYGVVYHVKKQLDGKDYAIKAIKICSESDHDWEKTTKEVCALASLEHSRILRYYHSWIGPVPPQWLENEVWSSSSDSKKLSTGPPTCLFIQTELCQGTLRDWLEETQRTHKRPRSTVIKYFEQILEAVQYIHQEGFIHRDLKPSNILFSRGKNIKVGDFGLATEMNKTESEATSGPSPLSVHSKHGSTLYRAPEQKSGVYSKKVDIFALGIILFEANVIFEDSHRQHQWMADLMTLHETNFEQQAPFQQIAKKLQYEAALLQLLLTHDPSQRPTAEEVYQSQQWKDLQQKIREKAGPLEVPLM